MGVKGGVLAAGKTCARTALRVYTATIRRPPERLETGPDGPPRILVQNVSGIGNALMATPLLAALREHFPESRIDFLTTPPAARLSAENPHVSHVFSALPAGSGRVAQYLPLLRTLRRNRYDAAFIAVPTIGFSQGIRPVLAGIPMRVTHGYDFKPQDDYPRFFTQVVPLDQTRHDVESNLDLFRVATGSEATAGHLVLNLSDEQKNQARRELETRGWDGGPLVALCPGSDAATVFKRWPIENYARLGAELLDGDQNLALAILCGPDERDDAAYLAEQLRGRRAYVVQNVPLPVYCAALGHCAGVVCADSLPVHVCAALQIPLVALYGPTDPRRTGPWMARARVVTPPCELTSFYRVPYPRPQDLTPSMPLISVTVVLAAVRDMLRG